MASKPAADGMITMGLAMASGKTADWGRKTIGNIIAEHHLRGANISSCPRPPGGPGWKDILKMTWDEIVKAAQQGKEWARVVKKEMLKPYNWPKK